MLVVGRDGRERRKLAQGATPTWAPDGRKLVFMREKKDEPDSTIWEIGFDGNGERRLTTGRWPIWSPDGKQLAFSRGGSAGLGVRPKSEIFLADADRGDPTFFALGDCPSWAPDGKDAMAHSARFSSHAYLRSGTGSTGGRLRAGLGSPGAAQSVKSAGAEADPRDVGSVV